MGPRNFSVRWRFAEETHLMASSCERSCAMRSSIARSTSASTRMATNARIRGRSSDMSGRAVPANRPYTEWEPTCRAPIPPAAIDRPPKSIEAPPSARKALYFARRSEGFSGAGAGMKNMKWIDAGDIKNWLTSNQRHCAQTLPELIRRLILATVTKVDEIEIFRAMTASLDAGWDTVISKLQTLLHFFPMERRLGKLRQKVRLARRRRKITPRE